jgi:hypothetical protein
MKAGIMSVYNSHDSSDEGGLKNYLNEKFFYEDADEKTPYPYATYRLDFPENFKDSADKFETVIMQVNIHSDATGSREIGDLASSAQNLFDSTMGNIQLPEGLYAIKVKRDFTKFFPKVDGVRIAVLQYRFNMQSIVNTVVPDPSGEGGGGGRIK